MSNFDLKIIPTSGNVIIIADSEFGEATVQVPREFIYEMIKASRDLRHLYMKHLYMRSLPSDSSSALDIEITKFGKTLFTGIFKSEVLDLLNRTIGGSIDGQLNIRLMLGSPALNTIQWEVMRYREEYIGFRHNLFRHPFVLRPVKVPRDSATKLHALVISVDPIYGPATIEQEHHIFCRLFDGFGDQIKLTALMQQEATIEKVIDVLFQGVDIWHFNGHGMFDENNPLESSLILWPSTEAERFRKLSVRSLRTLATSQSLGFCFLNACNTGRSAEAEADEEFQSTGEYFVNMAHSLIEAGIPMVVATNHEITVGAARRLSNRFYTSIVKYGRRVDQAVREARAELYLEGEDILPSDWSCPILYTRSRYNEIGTERLRWESSDIYSIRNVVKPASVLIREPVDASR
jgi:hypothetical protein